MSKMQVLLTFLKSDRLSELTAVTNARRLSISV